MTERCTLNYGDNLRCGWFQGHQGPCGPAPKLLQMVRDVGAMAVKPVALSIEQRYAALRDGIATALGVENPDGPIEDAVLIEQADRTLSQLFEHSREITEARREASEAAWLDAKARIAELEAERDAALERIGQAERAAFDYARQWKETSSDAAEDALFEAYRRGR